MEHSTNSKGSLVFAYLTLRRAIGILGVALPFVLGLGSLVLFRTGIQTSISSYYHTGMGDVFVGTMCAIGVFLLSYKGHERKDDWAGNVACVFAVCVAIFPTTPMNDPTNAQKIIGNFHLVFAASLFFILAYFSIILFTKTDPTKAPSQQKLRRNVVYKVCGYTILASILLIALQAIMPLQVKTVLKELGFVYWLESIAIIVFGISWLVKGEALLQDET